MDILLVEPAWAWSAVCLPALNIIHVDKSRYWSNGLCQDRLVQQPHKAPRCKKWAWRQHKGLCAVLTQVHKQSFSPVSPFPGQGSPIPALRQVLSIWGPAHSYRCADLAGTLHEVWPWHLSLTSYLSSKMSATYWKSLALVFVANLPCGCQIDVDWEGWSHGTQWHALCVPAEQKSRCLTPSCQFFQRKE